MANIKIFEFLLIMNKFVLERINIKAADVAQMARVPDCGSGGHGFESRRRYYLIKHYLYE